MKIHDLTKKPFPNTKIWRYMDLTKFLDLILNESLYFRRIDKFEDPYEGYISSSYKTSLRNIMNDFQRDHNISIDKIDKIHKSRLNGQELMPMYTYANCWYMSDVESAAMWKLYGENNNCIAICSTIHDLNAALVETPNTDGSIYLREIEYVNGSSPSNVNNWINPMLEKRTSFSHENEFRALYVLNKGLVNLSSADHIKEKKENICNSDGILIPVDIKSLINTIYISPTASSNFPNIVKRILELTKYNDIECIESVLYKLQ